MRNKKTKIMIIMCVAVLIMATGYAFFATKLNINTTGNITTTWNVYFSNITDGTIVGSASNNSAPSITSTTARMDVNLALPGDSITYELTLTNGGSVNAIIDDIKAEAEGSSAIIYTMSGINIGDKLSGGESKVITIKIEYDDVTSQPALTSKTLTVHISCVQDTGQTITVTPPTIEEKTLAARILKDNNAYADNVASPYVTSTTGIDFSQISSDTNGKGLYYTNVNTDDGKTTYYFRGNVTNNYVSFAGQTWRIVRINEDGSIRLITQGNVGTSTFNSNYNDNAYVGYMYGTAGSSTYAATHTNTNNSTIKTYLDTWYQNNLTSYSSYLADAGFCNDRSIASTAGSWDSIDTALGYGKNVTSYGSYNRLINLKKPQYVCSQSNDLFTTSSSGKGNKALTNPIGLITADEVTYAGGYPYITNPNYYLVNGSNFWTMSPSTFLSAYAWLVHDDGTVDGITPVGSAVGVRPVVNLASNVEIISGDGTVGRPYTIKVN